jgi:hypothetical protein
MAWLPVPRRRSVREELRLATHRRKRRTIASTFGALVPGPSFLRFDWTGAARVVFGGPSAGPVVDLPGGPFAAGATVIVQGQLVDELGNGIPSRQLAYLTMTLVDAVDMAVVNGRLESNVLNTGGGAVDSSGNLTLRLSPDDTALANDPGASRIQRSIILDWEWLAGTTVSYGRQQGNLTLVALAGTLKRK